VSADIAAHEAADGIETIRAWVDGARYDEELIELEAQTLRAALAEHDALLDENARMQEELERLRTVRTCGSTAVLPNGDEHVCVLPFGHGPEHRDGDGIRWQVYDAPPESDDSLKALLRTQGLTLAVSQQPWFNADAAPQQPVRDTADGGAECECGCQPGQTCICSVHDCDCIGDCPVCDADETEHAPGGEVL
jgi:hypothetical protein